MAYTKQQLQSIIDDAANKHGVSADHLKIIAGIESSYNPKAIGAQTRSGRAQGLFQFTPATAKGYGIADPLDPVQAADGAARYWKDLTKQFDGNLPLMIAQYNGGNSGVAAAKKGKVFEETAGYYNKFNKKAAELGLNSYIPVADYGVIPRKGSTAAKATPTATPAAVAKEPVKGFIEGRQDIRERELPTGDELVTAEGAKQYTEDNSTVLEGLTDFGNAAVEGAYASNYAAQGINFIKEDLTQTKQSNDGWADEATNEYITDRLTSAGIPRDNWDYVLQGVDDRNNFELRLGLATKAQDSYKEMAKSPAGAIVGSLFGGAADPTFWLSGGAGALVAAGRATRTAKLMAGATAGAAVDATLGEVVGSKVDAGYEDIDLLINAVGGAVGGVIGSFAKGDLGARIQPPTEGEIKVGKEVELPTGEAPRPPEDAPIPPVDTPEVEVPVVRPREEPPEDLGLPEGGEVVDAPRTDPWDSSWDEPERVPAFERGGEQGDTLVIPPNLSYGDSMLYIAKHGSEQEKKMVELLAQATRGITITKLGKGEDGAVQAMGALTDVRPRRLASFIGDATNDLANPRMQNAAAWAYQAVPRMGADDGLDSFDAFQYFKVYDYPEVGRKGISAENLIHETLHSVTTRWVRQVEFMKKNSTEGLPKAQADLVKAYDELNEVFNGLRTTSRRVAEKAQDFRDRRVGADVRGAYGFKNIKEFISEMASMPFAKSLARLEETVKQLPPNTAEVRTLRRALTKLMNAGAKFLKQVFGKDKDASAYVDGYRAAVLNFMDKVEAARKADAEVLSGMRAKVDGAVEPSLTIETPLSAAIKNAAEPSKQKTLEDYVKEYGGGTTFGKAQGAFTIESILQASDVPVEIRALGAKLVGATTGFRDGEVVARNTWDDTIALRESQKAAYLKGHHLQFEQYWQAKAGSGVKAKMAVLEKENAKFEFNDAVYRSLTSGEESTDPYVKAAVDFNRKFLEDWVDRINNPMGDEGGTMKGLTETVEEIVDEATGEVVRKVSGTLEKAKTYAPFQLSVAKINEAFARFGGEKVHKLLEDAFYNVHPELKAKLAEGGKDYGRRFSEWYLKQVLDSKVNRKFDYLHSLETSASGDDMVKAMVDNGIDPETAQAIVDSLLKKGEGTQAFNSSLRRRSAFDRQHAVTYEDGSTLSVYDLIDTDMGHIMDGYISRMSGAVGLAKNFDGASSLSDITRLFQEAKAREFGVGQLSDARVQEIDNAFNSAMNHILGRQLDDPSLAKLVMSSLRNLNVARLLGGSVLYQMVEFAQLLGTVGIRNTLRAMPELVGNIRRNVKTGKLDSEELNALEDLISGTGIDMLRYLDTRRGDEYQAYLGSNKWTKKADTADFMLKKAAGGLLKYTGMTPLLVIEKRLTLIALTRHFQDAVVDGKKLAYSPKRLASLGVSPEGYEAMAEAMRKYSSKTEKGRHKLDVAGWNRTDPDTFATFKVLLQRESRRVIQENDLGSHIPQLDNGWMKTFTQFRTFVLQAYSKALLYGVNHRDAQLASTLMYATGLGVIMQYARALSKASTMEEEERKEYLAKALKFGGAGGVLARSVASMSQASIMPQLFDTISPFGNLFDGYRSTTDSSELWANPTADLISAGFGAAKQVAYTVTGQDGLDQRDARAMLKLLPAQNALGISQAMGIMTSMLPKSSKAELLFDDEE